MRLRLVMGLAVGAGHAALELVIRGIIGNARQGRNGGGESRAGSKQKEEYP